MNRVRQLEDLLFREGWAFFVPYLVVYLACWALNVPTVSVRNLFVGLHFANLALLTDFIWLHKAEIRRSDLIFWSIVGLCVLLPGAYLEFPSDSWEHLRRIFLWQHRDAIADNEYRKRLAYFWGWTTMFWVEPIHRRFALDLYSAFWQLLLIFHFRDFLKRLNFSGAWLNLQTFAFFALFGHNLFGIRYYALSSTPLAYLAYFRFLALLMDGLGGHRRRYVAGIALVGLIFFNHRQEVGFAGLGALVLIAFEFYERLSQANRRYAHLGLLALIPVSFLFGAVFHQFLPDTFDRFAGSGITEIGSFRVWSTYGVYRETLGTHGVVALLLSAALLFCADSRLIGLLCLAPIAALVLPPSAYLISHYLSASMDAYRVLFAIPTSIGLVAGMRRFLDFRSKFTNLAISSVLVVVLGAPANFPWRGRLGFQLHRDSPERALTALDETAHWLLKNRSFPNNCSILSDNATRFVISAHLGLDEKETLAVGESIRLAKTSYGRSPLGQMDIDQFQKDLHLCGVLIAHARQITAPHDHGFGTRSGHWSAELGDLTWQTTAQFERSDEFLIRSGWKRTEIPPFYSWYDPPGAVAKLLK